MKKIKKLFKILYKELQKWGEAAAWAKRN